MVSCCRITAPEHVNTRLRRQNTQHSGQGRPPVACLSLHSHPDLQSCVDRQRHELSWFCSSAWKISGASGRLAATKHYLPLSATVSFVGRIQVAEQIAGFQHWQYLQPPGWNKYGGSTRLPRSSATGSHFHLLVARHLRYAMPGWPWSAWCQRMRIGFLPHGVCEHDHAVAKADGRTKDIVCNGNNPSCERSWLGSLPWSWPPLPRLSCAEHLGQNIFEDDYAFIVSDELPVLNRSFIIKDARLSPSVLWSACLQI